MLIFTLIGTSSFHCINQYQNTVQISAVGLWSLSPTYYVFESNLTKTLEDELVLIVLLQKKSMQW